MVAREDESVRQTFVLGNSRMNMYMCVYNKSK
jgi:DNA relaxase NicK